MINIIKHKYSEGDIKSGKELLWQLRGDKLGPYPNRSDSKNRKANDVNIEDIVNAVADLDVQNILPVFVAKDLSKLPDLQPEELNKLYYINRVASLEAQMKQHREELVTVNRYISQINDENQLQKDENKQLRDDILNINRALSQTKDDYMHQLDEVKAQIQIYILNKHVSKNSSYGPDTTQVTGSDSRETSADEHESGVVDDNEDDLTEQAQQIQQENDSDNSDDSDSDESVDSDVNSNNNNGGNVQSCNQHNQQESET